MPWNPWAQVWGRWSPARHSAWGAMLDQREILLAALSLQQTGGVRVQVFEHLHAPQDLPDLLARDDWLVQTLRGLGAHLPARLRTMVLAIGEDRCRQGVLEGEAVQDAHRLPAEVQLEAAQAWGVGPDAVGFDFRIDGPHAEQGLRVHWAACLREELQQWRQHARSAGWRLPVVEPEHQAAQRAAVCLGAQTLRHWADSPQDWQSSRTPVRDASEVDWPRLQAGPMWKPLVACGAALGALS